MVQVLLKFGSLEVWQYWFPGSMLVADIESDGLIGIDFFKAQDCELRYKDRILVIRDFNVPFREERGRQVSCRIRAAGTVIVPPGCEVILQGKIQQRQHSPSHAVFESISSFGRDTRLMVGKALIDTTKGEVPVRVLNPRDEPIEVLGGTDIALAQPVLGVESVVKEEDFINGLVNQVSQGRGTGVSKGKFSAGWRVQRSFSVSLAGSVRSQFGRVRDGAAERAEAGHLELSVSLLFRTK